jgi:hypothetical protein
VSSRRLYSRAKPVIMIVIKISNAGTAEIMKSSSTATMFAREEPMLSKCLFCQCDGLVLRREDFSEEFSIRTQKKNAVDTRDSSQEDGTEASL